MIEFFIITLISFFSGALGIVNLIGTGFIFQFINLISKLANGPDISWRIHLGNFLISCFYMIFNFKYILDRITYLILSLIIMLPSWLLGKMIFSQFQINNYKTIFILMLLIISIINFIHTYTDKINENNDVNHFNIERLNSDDFYSIGISSLLSSCFEINFGVILVSLLFLVKSKIKIKSIANLVFFNMLLYSGLNLIWFILKKEIVFYQNKEFYIFLSISAGALSSLLLFRNINDKYLHKISSACILIYLITFIFGKII